MSDIFILQNQDKLFLGKQKEWLDGRDPGSLFKTLYKDEAINQLVEISSKDYTQRIKVLSCSPSEKGLPLIDETLLPPPQPKAAKVKANSQPAPVAGSAEADDERSRDWHSDDQCDMDEPGDAEEEFFSGDVSETEEVSTPQASLL